MPATPTAPPGPALSAVPSTLRIPLAARALGDPLFPRVAVGDAHAAAALAALGDDGAHWLGDRASVYGVLARTRRFRALAADFLAEHPRGQVVNLGCGLAHYFQWLDNGQARMTDADLPEVLKIRRAVLPPAGARHRLLELDLSRDGWWAALGLPQGSAEPVFLMAEGVLMYLPPDQVASVLRTVGESAPAGSRFAFDALCWLANGQARWHPSVRRTGAQFRWGPRHPGDLTAPSPRLHLATTHPVMDGFAWPIDWGSAAFHAWFGVPPYAVYELHIDDL